MIPLPILAIDASCYAIRAALIQERHCLMDSFESQPHGIYNLVTFLKEWQEQIPRVSIVACPLDRWPEGMEKKLRNSGISIDWLSPDLMRGVGRALAPWNKKRRLHRARLLAYIASNRNTPEFHNARALTLCWEAYMARETIDEVNGEISPNSDEGFAE